MSVGVVWAGLGGDSLPGKTGCAKGKGGPVSCSGVLAHSMSCLPTRQPCLPSSSWLTQNRILFAFQVPGAARLGRSAIFCFSGASHRGAPPLRRWIWARRVTQPSSLRHSRDRSTAGKIHFAPRKINKYKQGPSALTPLDISICVHCLDLQNAGKPVCGRGLSGQKVGKNLDPRCYTEVATSELLHMPNGKCHCYLRHVWFHLPLCFRQKHPERCV